MKENISNIEGRLQSLLKLITLPCSVSLDDMAKATGTSVYNLRKAISNLDGKAFRFSTRVGRCKSSFEPLEDVQKKTEEKPKVSTNKMYLQYADSVFLTEREYNKLLDVFAYTGNAEYYRELAINILQRDKEADIGRRMRGERTKYDDDLTSINKDMGRLLTWVKSTIHKKYLKKQAQAEAQRMIAEEESPDNRVIQRERSISDKDVSKFSDIVRKRAGIYGDALTLIDVTNDMVVIRMPSPITYDTFIKGYNGKDFFDKISKAFERKVKVIYN